MARWLIPLIAFVAIAWLYSSFTNQQLLAPVTLLFAVFALAVLQKLKIIRAIPFVPQRYVTAILILSGIAVFVMGGFAFFLPGITLASLQGQITPSAGAYCIDNPELVGKSATLTINAYNMESSSPYSAPVDVNPTYVVSAGGVELLTDTSSATLQTHSAGERIKFVGGSSSYYLDDKEVCIDSQNKIVELSAHAVISNSEALITCKDSDGYACSAGTNSSQEDYDITLGANQETTFSLKYKVNTADKTARLYAVAIFSANDIAECAPVSPELTLTTTPKFLKDVTVTDGAGSYGHTRTYTVYTLPQPILLREWESKEFTFRIKAGSNDPSNSQNFQQQDMCVVCFLDATKYKGSDGNVYDDFYTHDESQSNVGISESVASPVGAKTCVVIEGI